MLLVSTSFIINTSIFSLFLFIVFRLIKGHTAIFNNLHFFSTLVTFRFFIEIIYASSYQIYIKSSGSNIRIWSLVVLIIFYFVFVLTVMIPLVCAFCVDVTLCLQERESSWSSNYYFEEEDTLKKIVTLPHF